jgi:hypothetical protein
LSRHQTIKILNKKYTERIEIIRCLENDLKRSYFPPNYIPDRHCSARDKKTGQKYPLINDVIKYVQGDEYQEEIFNEPRTCESVYNICE